jgi:WD40 repeat protein
VAVAGGSPARAWDLRTGKIVRALEGHSGEVVAVAVTIDGRHGLTVGAEGEMRVWRLATGCLRIVTGVSAVSAAMTADARTGLTLGSDGVLRAWNLEAGVCVFAVEAHGGGGSAVALSRSGRAAVTGGADRCARVWALDWQLVARDLAMWDEGARPWVDAFHACGRGDVGELLRDLAEAGYGWVREEGVKARLKGR